MKSKFFILVFSMVSLALFSCSSSSSFEKDARRVAKLMCKEQQLEKKAVEGDEAAKKELEKVREERDKLKDELSQKYKNYEGDEKTRKKARDIVEEVMRECK